jgi:hypothetical protein
VQEHTACHYDQSVSLRARWLIAIVGAAVAITAVVIVVRSAGTEGAGSGGGTPQEEATAAAEANNEARTVINHDQAPHTTRIASGEPLLPALRQAITGDVHARIGHGELTGPLQSVSCHAQPARGQRQPFACTVRSAGIPYPFLAVADEAAGTLTWCKEDPPAPGERSEVPVSPSCRA